MRIRQPAHDFYGINVIPMIDTMMFLLVFFLMATKFADVERDVRVKPPGSVNARPIASMPQELVINVSRDGKLLVAGQERDIADIDKLIGIAKSENLRQTVVVRGDRNVVLQYVVNVLDICEKHGVEHTCLTTVQPGG
ncbi:MAG: biopolymer transporter ExbD [bacterium]